MLPLPVLVKEGEGEEEGQGEEEGVEERVDLSGEAVPLLLGVPLPLLLLVTLWVLVALTVTLCVRVGVTLVVTLDLREIEPLEDEVRQSDTLAVGEIDEVVLAQADTLELDEELWEFERVKQVVEVREPTFIEEDKDTLGEPVVVPVFVTTA